MVVLRQSASVTFVNSFLLLLGQFFVSPVISAEPVPPDHAAKMAASQELFKSKVRPFLVAQCLECHGGSKTKSGFSLATREDLLAGGDRGVSVILGQGRQSPLVRYVAREDEPHMPPKQAAPREAVEFLAKWIDLGAAYDQPLVDSTKASTKQPLTVTGKDKDYWAYRTLQPTVVPDVKDSQWPRTVIDRFILAQLESKGIAPAADADRRTLIRRVTFDLIGLPPTPEEVEAFVSDTSPNAFETLVDRLLASPQFGERWARHWLDPARFAESHGFEHDYLRPTAYTYRDFVIRAFNADMPYDQFVRWQIAGDELAPSERDAFAATGFLAAGVYPTQITTREAERVRYDAMDDMLATLGHAFLALTVGCARCHDHKYDPIPSQDYYRMLSAFTTTVRAEVDWVDGPQEVKNDKAKPDPGSAPPPPQRMLVCVEGFPPQRLHKAVASIPDFYPETYFLNRGDPAQKNGVASQGFLQALTRHPDGDQYWLRQREPTNPRSSYRRAALADWLTDVQYGAGSLAARVIVNRLWHHHFGRGIVATVNDFGFQGDPPTHPELLEYLAKDLVDHGWNLKRLHKLIVTSRVYQLSSQPTESGRRLDPDNRLWHHRPKRRLEAEAIRDALLAVSGRLDLTMFGPGTLDPAMTRRSIYFTVQRSKLIPMLQVFDWPDTLTSAGARPVTTVPTQALFFLNNPEVRKCAEGLAKRIEGPQAVDQAYRLALGRPPTSAERKAGEAFLKQGSLVDFAHAVLALNEFISVE